MINKHLVVLTLTTVVFAASGCGESTKSTTQTATQTSTQTSSQVSSQATIPSVPAPPAQKTSLTRADLSQRASTICRQTSAKRDRLVARSPTEFAALIPLVAAGQRSMYAEVSKLEAPAALAAEWKRFVTEARVLAESSTRLISYGQNATTAGVKPLKEFGEARLRLRAIASRAGFKGCVKF
jgi:hypothetical protein